VATGEAATAFILDDAHALLRDVIEKVCSETADNATRNGHGEWHRPIWHKLAELDVLGAPLPTAAHGGGGGPIELMVIMLAMGKHLATVPYIATIACAGQLLAQVGSPSQIQGRLRQIIAGEHTTALCALEQGDRGELSRIKTTATPHRGGYRITGKKSAVLGADQCDSMLVVAELADSPGRHAAFFVTPDAAGVGCEHRSTLDGGRAAEIYLNDVFVGAEDSLGAPEGISEQIEAMYDLAVVGLCAQACGSIEAMFWSTVDYVRTREQFGQPVGRFQVVQHRIVDMGGLLEQATAITHWAAASFGMSTSTRRRAVAAAKAYVGRAGRTVAQEAVQLHGAIGTTRELALSRHLRRIEIFNTRFGTSSDHATRFLNEFASTPLGFESDRVVAVG
jgi:alkylation response protein AidB-like acyl-CoA dehydrogenase